MFNGPMTPILCDTIFVIGFISHNEYDEFHGAPLTLELFYHDLKIIDVVYRVRKGKVYTIYLEFKQVVYTYLCAPCRKRSLISILLKKSR